MNTRDFTTSILVDKTPEEAFECINNVSGWWPGEIKGHTSRLNDEFTYQYREFHFSRQKITESVPGRRIAWLVTESSLNFVKDRGEWTGTRIMFDIAAKNGKTQIRFTHEGLVPTVECFDACSNAWTDIITSSLAGFIATGKGEKEIKEARAGV